MVARPPQPPAQLPAPILAGVGDEEDRARRGRFLRHLSAEVASMNPEDRRHLLESLMLQDSPQLASTPMTGSFSSKSS